MGGWRRSCALADLPGDVLALVADSLALVGLRRPLLADDGGDLADLLLVVALDDHARRLRHLELDALRRLDRHGMRVAERQLEVAALELRAVADALDLEGLGKARRDTFHHVRHERAGEPVQGAVLGAVRRAGDEQLLALLLDVDRAVLALEQVTSRAGHADDLRLDRDGHAGGDGDGLLSDAAHLGYQTSATTSPPTPARRASWPVITPCDVDTMAVPMPPRTFGMCLATTSVRCPGRDTRRRPEMTDVRSSVYLRRISSFSAAAPGMPGASS